MHATTIGTKSLPLPAPRAAVGTTLPAMFAAAARLEAQLAFARVEYAMPCYYGSRPPRSVKRRDHHRKRPLSPMMLVATDVTEQEDFEQSPLVVRDSSSADARAHAGAQPGNKRQRASPLASGGEPLPTTSRAYSLGFNFGYKPGWKPQATPAAASSGAASSAPPPATRFAADRPPFRSKNVGECTAA